MFRIFSVVVLPAPFGPSRPKIAPRGTVNDSPSTARSSGARRRRYVLTRSSTRRAGSFMGDGGGGDRHAAARGTQPSRPVATTLGVLVGQPPRVPAGRRDLAPTTPKRRASHRPRATPAQWMRALGHTRARRGRGRAKPRCRVARSAARWRRLRAARRNRKAETKPQARAPSRSRNLAADLADRTVG